MYLWYNEKEDKGGVVHNYMDSPHNSDLVYHMYPIADTGFHRLAMIQMRKHCVPHFDNFLIRISGEKPVPFTGRRDWHMSDDLMIPSSAAFLISLLDGK